VSEAQANPAQDDARTGFGGLPPWLRIGIVAAATIVVVLIVSVIIRIVLQTPAISFGPTAVDELEPGSCLVEPGGDEATYTVVTCGTAHQQQVIARVDLAFPGVDYTADESLAIFAHETCDRLLEYRLFLTSDLVKSEYATIAIDAPTLADYEAGRTTTLCAVLDNPDVPKEGGKSEDLTTDVYHPMPQ